MSACVTKKSVDNVNFDFFPHSVRHIVRLGLPKSANSRIKQASLERLSPHRVRHEYTHEQAHKNPLSLYLSKSSG